MTAPYQRKKKSMYLVNTFHRHLEVSLFLLFVGGRYELDTRLEIRTSVSRCPGSRCKMTHTVFTDKKKRDTLHVS